MKTFFLCLFLTPSLASALWVEAIFPVPQSLGMENVPAVGSLREAVAVQPEKLPRLSEGRGSNYTTTRQVRAVNLIFQGDYPQAIRILEGIGDCDIGGFSRPLDLATAYELNGDNRMALKIIQERLYWWYDKYLQYPDITPVVLDAKIKAQESGLPFSGRLLQIPDQLSYDELIAVHGKNYPAEKVKKGLFAHLKDRLIFAKAPDPYAADLLYNYALLEANLGSPGKALDTLELAREYGFPDLGLIQQQQSQFKEWNRTAWIFFLGQVLFVGLAVTLFLSFAYRKKWHLSVTLGLAVARKYVWRIASAKPELIPTRRAIPLDRY